MTKKLPFFIILFVLLAASCVLVSGSGGTTFGDANSYAVSYAYNTGIISHAEYEQSNELIITSNDGSLYLFDEPYFIDIIRVSERALQVRINVDNFIQRNRVIAELHNAGIPVDNITVSITPTKSIWIRDYGPFFIENEGVLGIVDFNYLKIKVFRLLDNIYPTLYGLKNNIAFDFKANFALCIQGGNYMVDRQGTALVSADTLVKDNPWKTLAEMRGILQQYLGVDEVLFLASQKDDGTGHIDMYSKLVADDHVLVGQWDVEDINYQILENNTQVLLDKGYTVTRIPMLRDPDEENDTIWSYTNSLIINGTHKNIVLVPLYGVDEDVTAISIYEQVLPGYEIVGIDCRPVIDLLGAIHCTTLLRPDIESYQMIPAPNIIGCKSG